MDKNKKAPDRCIRTKAGQRLKVHQPHAAKRGGRDPTTTIRYRGGAGADSAAEMAMERLDSQGRAEARSRAGRPGAGGACMEFNIRNCYLRPGLTENVEKLQMLNEIIE